MTVFPRRVPTTLVLVAVLLAARTAVADGPVAPTVETSASPPTSAAPPAEAQAPRPTGALISFDKPRVWPASLEETWRLVDRGGNVICELPCSSPVPPASGYVLEGVGTFATDVPSGAGTWSPGVKVGQPLRLALPERIDVGPFARLHREVDPRGRVWARVHPGKGSPNGAIALGIVSGVVLAFGVAVLAVDVLVPCSGDGCAGKGFFLIPGFGLTGIGLVGAVGALAWGVSSARPGIDFSPDRPAAPLASDAQAVHVKLSPPGLVGTF